MQHRTSDLLKYILENVLSEPFQCYHAIHSPMLYRSQSVSLLDVLSYSEFKGSETGGAYGPHETHDTTVFAAEILLATGIVPGRRTQRAYGEHIVPMQASEALEALRGVQQFGARLRLRTPRDELHHNARGGDISSHRDRFGPPNPTRVRTGARRVERRKRFERLPHSKYPGTRWTCLPHETHGGTSHATDISLVVRTVPDGPD